jgi:hypothetical protein
MSAGTLQENGTESPPFPALRLFSVENGSAIKQEPAFAVKAGLPHQLCTYEHDFPQLPRTDGKIMGRACSVSRPAPEKEVPMSSGTRRVQRKIHLGLARDTTHEFKKTQHS